MRDAPAPVGRPRRGFWNGSGGLRELMRLVLGERLDEVEVSARDGAILRDLERCGFPLTSAAAHQCWHAPGAPGHSTAEGLPWQTLDANRPAGNSKGGDQMLEAGAISLRRDARTGRVFATGPDRQEAWTASPLAAGHALWIEGAASVAMGALASRGYTPGAMAWSILLSPMLTYSLTDPVCLPFAVSADDVERYGRSSGDMNPLHFDDDFARAHGFEARIAHGMLFNGWLTRYLGMEYPGAGTIFRRSSALYFAPVYPGRSYRVRISTTNHEPGKGALRIVAQLLDGDDAPCLVCYNDVVHRGQ